MKTKEIFSVSVGFTMVSYLLFKETTDFSDGVYWAAAVFCLALGILLGKYLSRP